MDWINRFLITGSSSGISLGCLQIFFVQWYRLICGSVCYWWYTSCFCNRLYWSGSFESWCKLVCRWRYSWCCRCFFSNSWCCRCFFSNSWCCLRWWCCWLGRFGGCCVICLRSSRLTGCCMVRGWNRRMVGCGRGWMWRLSSCCMVSEGICYVT